MPLVRNAVIGTSLVALGVAILGVACSAPGGAPAATPPAPTDGGALDADAYADPPVDPKRAMAIADACARQASTRVERWPSLDATERAQWTDYYLKACVADGLAPGSTISAAFVDGCTQALRGRDTCLTHEPLACVPPPGSRPDGSSCVSPHQCASGYCPREVIAASRLFSFGCGVCTTPPPVVRTPQFCFCPLGTACETLGKPTSGYYWQVSGGLKECRVPDRENQRDDQPRGVAGTACSDDGDCTGLLRCVDGRCSGVGLGARCDPSFFSCDPALVCSAPGQCVAPTLAIGDACSANQGTCPVDAECRSTCVPRPRIGEPCDAKIQRCWAPLGETTACIDGTCARIPLCPATPPPFNRISSCPGPACVPDVEYECTRK